MIHHVVSNWMLPIFYTLSSMYLTRSQVVVDMGHMQRVEGHF